MVNVIGQSRTFGILKQTNRLHVITAAQWSQSFPQVWVITASAATSTT